MANIETRQSDQEVKLIDLGQYKSIEHESRIQKIATS